MKNLIPVTGSVVESGAESLLCERAGTLLTDGGPGHLRSLQDRPDLGARAGPLRPLRLAARG